MSNFDFSTISGLGKDWSGDYKKRGSHSGGDHHLFNTMGQIDNIQLLYQNLVGRNPDSEGQDYWDKQISSGAATYNTLADTLKASKEFTDQQDYIDANPNWTSQDLKKLDSAYMTPFNPYSGSSLSDYIPFGNNITQEMAEALSPGSGGGYDSDQLNKNVGDAKAWAIQNILDGIPNPPGGIYGGHGDHGKVFGSGVDGVGSNTNITKYEKYDDSALRGLIGGLGGQLSSLRDAFDAYKMQSATDMQNMYNNAMWGYGDMVGGVRTQNELPGWSPRKGGTSGFFGRGGRAGKGLTTGSLNI